MRLAILPILLPMLLVGHGASAEFSLFGTPSQAPTNPFASNYASAPVRGSGIRGDQIHGSEPRPRRVRRHPAPRPQPLRPPRVIPQ